MIDPTCWPGDNRTPSLMFTGLLIAILVVAGAATVVAGGVVLAQRKRQLPGPDTLALPGDGHEMLLERTIRDLRTGDVLAYDGKDFLVEGVVSYDEDGHRWSASRIVDGNDNRWLIVGMERGGSFVVRVAQVAEDIDIDGYPPETLLVGDTRFTLDKRGTATARMSGDTGLGRGRDTAMDAVERCRWWLYDTPDDDTIIVEQWSDEYRVLRGTKVNPSLLDLMPGS